MLIEFFDNISICNWQWLHALVFIALAAVYWMKRYPNSYPPGPWGVPLLGYPFLGDFPPGTLAKLSRKYGGVFSLRMLFSDVVVVNDWESMKEALGSNNIISPSRGRTLLADLILENKSFIFTNGPHWSEHRSFFVKTMGQLGMGKRTTENIVAEEMAMMLSSIKKLNGRPIDTDTLFNFNILNCLWNILSDTPLELNAVNSVNSGIRQVAFLVGTSPVLSFAPSLYKYFGLENNKASQLVSTMEKVNKIIRNHVELHTARFTPDRMQKDFIDQYLHAIKKGGTEHSTFTCDDLTINVSGVFMAGLETSVTSLRWYMLYMACYPEVQEKIQAEIESIIGNQTIQLSHQPLLPYTGATLMELLRMVVIVPLSLLHAASENTTLAGYTIPKGTFVMTNLWAVHYDPKIFPDPHRFSPERFLDNEGKVVKKPPQIVTFSMGKRSCPGEPLARMELFLFFTALLQNFKILLPEGAPKPDLNKAIFGATLVPFAHQLIFKERHY